MRFWDLIRHCVPCASGKEDHRDTYFSPDLRPMRAESGNARSRIVICSPDQLEQTEYVVDLLQSGCSVLLSLQTDKRDVARRLLDFIAGVAYYNENQIQWVAPSTFLILPYDAEVETIGHYGGYCS